MKVERYVLAVIGVIVTMYIGLFGLNMGENLLDDSNLTVAQNNTYNTLTTTTVPITYDILTIILIVFSGFIGIYVLRDVIMNG